VADSYRLSAEVLHQYGQRLLVHVGGPIRHLLTPMTEVGVDGVEGVAGPPQGDVSLAQAREIVGRRLVLWGGIPQDFLLDMRDRQEFEATVVKAVQEAKSDSRMILGVADRVPVDADLSRLESIPALVEQALSG
jgi:uroporphyrinogen-III decarboxylase